MRELKFRQPVLKDDKFDHWHYWGFIDENFVNPIADLSLWKSQQHIGRDDKAGTGIYEGDIVESIKDLPGWMGLPLIVGYSNINMAFMGARPNDMVYKFSLTGVERLIIGNVTENPEMIKCPA